MTLKLDAYQELKTQAPMAGQVAALAAATDKNENDRVDTALLNEVYQGRVDLLITEDKRLRRKAELLGLGHKVLSINAFLTIATSENPSLIEYKALAVKKVPIGSLDVNNEFLIVCGMRILALMYGSIRNAMKMPISVETIRTTCLDSYT